MSKITTVIFVLCSWMASYGQKTDQYITRQGQTSFFSYTSVENIKASNNQALSILDIAKKEIAIVILMRAFVFEKALMEEHFNESYIESDIYPKATFEGSIPDFDGSLNDVQTKMIKGVLTVHGVDKNIEIKTKIEKTKEAYAFSGDFEVDIADFDINVPPIVEKNIAKTISITFRFEYMPYEE